MIRKIPDKILEIVGNQSSFSNNVGMSGSEVLIYPDYVLKVQAESEETKNERDIVEWLDGQILVPEIPVYCVEDGTAFTLMSRIHGKMGPADRWQDIAIALRSLNHNSVGFYNGGKKYFDFTNQMLLDELGIEMDYDKYRYYILLDELF